MVLVVVVVVRLQVVRAVRKQGLLVVHELVVHLT